MTHEMVHLAMPEMSDNQAWLEEGLATYVEPVARARVGQLTPEKIWHDMVSDMPKGLPGAGDRGLDNTHTWGRTYWGGAIFYLLADVRIRERTDNRLGLQDALRAIVAGGGNVQVAWDVRRTLETGDKATGTKVLVELYDEMRATPVTPDLAQLWQRLGVKLTREGAEFDDAAPLAAIRRAITAQSAG
jgi:predicted metalloprotease with PDZ domain